jgi:sarcosine oxidase gamma subunit
MAVSDQQRAENHARQLQKGLRQIARAIANDDARSALDNLLAVGPPDWFTVEQRGAYDAELRSLRDRIRESTVARTYRIGQAQPGAR